MESVTDVVVIGGGAIGCALAYYLRKAQFDVVVLERGEIGCQASGAAAGLLAPLGPLSGPGPFADLVLAGFRMFPALVSELEALSGLHLGYEQSGALRTVRSEKRIARLRKRYTSWQPLGLTMHWLDGEQARQMEPGLAEDICAAVYAPEEAQIEAPLLVSAFAQVAQKLGAKIYTNQEVSSLETEGERVTGVCTAQGARIACRYVVIASGAWAAQCSAWLYMKLPVSPLHGQMLTLPQPAVALRHIIFGEAAYLAPRGEHVLVGATKEETGFEQPVLVEGTGWLYETAGRLVPELTKSVVTRAWAGLRPRTPDNHPIFGFLPGWENALIAAGHNSVGIILSALSGRDTAELLITGKMSAAIQPFTAARFVTPS